MTNRYKNWNGKEKHQVIAYLTSEEKVELKEYCL